MHGAAGDRRELSEGRNVDEGVREQEQVNGAAKLKENGYMQTIRQFQYAISCKIQTRAENHKNEKQHNLQSMYISWNIRFD